ncbi:hypothetical protein [Nocardioides sp. SYSU D00065]|uniref:hypothetical protein n=1 Tax=Nocardioides sp. SYSU D00065 TaxID=2817378 RepID=UPI001B32B012|nr:hypothetical protein [Nocardioides sp. SYSU D00065]
MSIDTTPLAGVRTSRRSLVRGAAWTVPVVAVATTAPAFAASPCASTTIVWSAVGSSGSTFVSTTSGGVVVTLTVSGQTTALNNRTISNVQTGGQSSNLRFYSTSANNSAQTATFTFTRNGQPVDVINLRFSFLDIDSGGANWDDRVTVNTPGFAYTIANQTYVTGNGGTGSNAFRANGYNTSAATPGNTSNGNVAVSWAGPISSMSFTYAQDGSASGSPFIGISNMSFQPVIC